MTEFQVLKSLNNINTILTWSACHPPQKIIMFVNDKYINYHYLLYLYNPTSIILPNIVRDHLNRQLCIASGTDEILFVKMALKI